MGKTILVIIGVLAGCLIVLTQARHHHTENKRELLEEGENVHYLLDAPGFDEATEIELAIASLENRLSRRMDKVEEKFLGIQGICHVKYDNKCFWGVFPGPGTTSFTDGQALCARRGGKPAAIYSKTHYDILVQYSLPYVGTKAGPLGLYTAMKVDTEAGRLTLPDGSPAPSLKWNRSYPGIGSQHAANTAVLLLLQKTDDGEIGMINDHPEARYYGVLCEVDISMLA